MVNVREVIDFGSSCYEHQRVYTYIQSRFYRAPEVMMGAKYGMPIDMWSLGCILAELLTGQWRLFCIVCNVSGVCFVLCVMYTHVQSRFYRAPEVMMGAKYGMPIDMWSLGCILAELLTGFPLLPGEDEADQMACIIELLGMPPQRLIEQGKRSKNFISSKGLPRYCTATMLPDGTTLLSSGMSRRGKPRGLPGSKSFVTALKGCQDKYFIDFIRRCLEWEPEKRLTPAAALRHAWLRRRLPRPPHDDDPSPAPPANSSGGSGCAGAGGAAGARGGSLRTPLARTPVTFNASQVAKAKLQAALSEESSGLGGLSGLSGSVGSVGAAGARYWAAGKLPHLPAPS
ncbi:dual specificity tyrosine-phosphorylation-regulated kinase 2-like [Bicyclus anynana]|uniref:Dual specificity tyrosine-phosphorylation-regulated kinase 2-like n=1 Tax=Bicyclus anynana TaxID=110368 RepID=A0ABM3M2Y9_BICAN|nr:dual specificity tyrosine-phosphorylation-regulated kinase 2-like [Bicyclus anynana]